MCIRLFKKVLKFFFKTFRLIYIKKKIKNLFLFSDILNVDYEIS